MTRKDRPARMNVGEANIFFGSHSLIAACLLFLCEPMSAKQLLPRYGGASSVWITALLFFQAALLLGYLYARFLTKMQPFHARVLHLSLLGCGAVASCLSLCRPSVATFRSNSWALDHPAAAICSELSGSYGIPFLLLASTSPLSQLWYARVADSTIPYRLYALSNGGSLLALLAYPVLVEPWLPLRLQQLLWTAAFILFILMSCLTTLRVTRDSAESRGGAMAQALTAPRSSRQRLLWFFLPFAGALQLSSVTAHLTVNIAAVPLLWILPLAVYLFSFIVAFDRPNWYRRSLVVRLLVVLLASLSYLLTKTDVDLPLRMAIVFFVLELFLACLFLHAELFSLRPENEDQATNFYVYIAAGSAAGTCFVAVLSPLLFNTNYDLPISFFVTALLAVCVTWPDGWPQRLLWLTSSVLLISLMGMLHAVYARDVLFAGRNFYGALRVKQVLRPDGVVMRTLLHGSIQHGTQLFGNSSLSPDDAGADHRREPTTYYARNSGVGLVLSSDADVVPRRLGVVGLGAGTLAAYGKAQDTVTFFEIDPMVPPLAHNLFTYLRDSPAHLQVVLGDARVALSKSPERFDVLAVDAFSGDAVPLHLLTTQAMAVYRQHLTPAGLLAFHVSNQYVNLAPEIDLQARASRLTALLVNSPAEPGEGAFAASWVLVGTANDLGRVPGLVEHSQQISPVPGLSLWTDDFSSLLPLLR